MVLVNCQGRRVMQSITATGGTILCFHYESIFPNTVLVPARCVRVQRDVQHTWLHQEVEDLAQVLPMLLLLQFCMLHRVHGPFLMIADHILQPSTKQKLQSKDKEWAVCCFHWAGHSPALTLKFQCCMSGLTPNACRLASTRDGLNKVPDHQSPGSKPS